jgi:hypothetical protein
VSLRIGRRSPALDAVLGRLGARRAVMLTACNPRSRRMPAGWNTRMMRRLREALRRRAVLPAESGAGRWREAQWLVACAPAWGAQVARRFRQNAILCLWRHRPSRLVPLVSCV